MKTKSKKELLLINDIFKNLPKKKYFQCDDIKSAKSFEIIYYYEIGYLEEFKKRIERQLYKAMQKEFGDYRIISEGYHNSTNNPANESITLVYEIEFTTPQK